MKPTRSLRLAIGGLFHETNTFATRHTGHTPLAAFARYEGPAIGRAFEGANNQVGGFIDGVRAAGDELVFTVFAEATPSGTIAAEAYQALKCALLDRLREALPVDGVLLALHGAGVAEGVDDVEGDLAAAVRDLVGPEVPIGAAYDLHGNLTPRMAESCDLTIPCRLYPHTDFGERAALCAGLLRRVVVDGLRPVTAVRQLPMLHYIVSTKPGLPPAEIDAVCRALSERDGVLDCGCFHGFPLADIAAPCPAVLCTTDGDAALAHACAEEAAAALWERRERLRPDLPSPADGVRAGLAATALPFVIGEYADNPGGGAPGDGTHLLRALIEAGPEPGTCCFGTINDPAVVRQAVEAGVGASVRVSLGGKLGPDQGRPIVAEARVDAVSDGRFRNRAGSMFGGVLIDMGPMCRLAISGVDVLVASRAEQIFDPEPFHLHGIDVGRRRIVALKGANHFRAGFKAVAGTIITVDGGGLSSSKLETFPRRGLAGPVWPLDPDVAWDRHAPSYPLAAAEAR